MQQNAREEDWCYMLIKPIAYFAQHPRVTTTNLFIDEGWLISIVLT